MNTPDSVPTLPAPPAPGEKFRILVVEDEQDIARLVLVTLAKTGFEARHAPDGPTALQAFREVPPHLVILDLMLPGMDGQQICTEIRKISNAPIIIATASDSEAVEVQSFKPGADDFVSKPFNPQLLIARIVANLRRTYRYDNSPVESSSAGAQPYGGASTMSSSKDRDLAKIAGIKPVREEDEPVLPAGWAKCESCGYMGPRVRFENENALGNRSLLCPNCRQSDFIVFALG